MRAWHFLYKKPPGRTFIMLPRRSATLKSNTLPVGNPTQTHSVSASRVSHPYIKG